MQPPGRRPGIAGQRLGIVTARVVCCRGPRRSCCGTGGDGQCRVVRRPWCRLRAVPRDGRRAAALPRSEGISAPRPRSAVLGASQHAFVPPLVRDAVYGSCRGRTVSTGTSAWRRGSNRSPMTGARIVRSSSRTTTRGDRACKQRRPGRHRPRAEGRRSAPRAGSVRLRSARIPRSSARPSRRGTDGARAGSTCAPRAREGVGCSRSSRATRKAFARMSSCFHSGESGGGGLRRWTSQLGLWQRGTATGRAEWTARSLSLLDDAPPVLRAGACSRPGGRLRCSPALRCGGDGRDAGDRARCGSVRRTRRRLGGLLRWPRRGPTPATSTAPVRSW